MSDLASYNQAVVDSIPQSLLLIDVKKDLAVLINQQCQRAFNVSSDEGVSAKDILGKICIPTKIITAIFNGKQISNYYFESRPKENSRYVLELSSWMSSIDDHILIQIANHTARKQIEEVVLSESEQVRLTLDSIDDAVITTDMAGNIIYMNPTAERYTGIHQTDARTKPLNSILHLSDSVNGQTVASVALDNLDDNPDFDKRYTYRLVLPDESEIIVEEYSAPMKDHKGAVIGLIVVLRDVTKLRELISDISYRATHDDLTGLINRREFESRLNTVLTESKTDRTEHALLYLDLDQFKIINDTCGHSAGDSLLKEVTVLTQQEIRAHDILARFGGDEFGILLEHCSQDKSVIIAENIRKTLKEYRFSWGVHIFSISVSIGIVPLNADQNDLIHVMSLADTACYSAKQAGRNRIQLYKPDDEVFADKYGEMRWIPIVSKAVDEDRILLYFQTIAPANGETGEGEHYEILMRMVNNTEIIPPGIIIPAAENFNLITTIDRWVVEHTFEFMAEHPTILDRLSVCSINLSAQTIQDDRFLGFLESELERYEIPAEKICFEITETTAIGNFQQANKFIKHVRRLGCCFALDDFGTGMCSFSYLKNLKVDYLKIDGIFVKSICENEVDSTIVQSFNDIAHVMGMKTVAEFVENDQIRQKLVEMGVDYVQGYAIDRPKPIEVLR